VFVRGGVFVYVKLSQACIAEVLELLGMMMMMMMMMMMILM